MKILLICIALNAGFINSEEECTDPEWVTVGAKTFGKCNLEEIGYKPSGSKIELTPVLSVTATLQKTVIEKVTENAEKTTNALDQATASIEAYTTTNSATVFQKIASFAPKLASTFGIFGLAFSLISSEYAIGPENVLESTNLAFKEMTKRMNDKFDDMVEYIDQEIIESDRRWLVNEFRKIQTQWYNCKSRIHDEDDLYDCQKDAVADIRSDFHHFMKFNTERESDQNLDFKNVKKLETFLEPFRDYVTFSITSVDALAGSYEIDAITCKPNSENFCKTYLKYQIKDIEMFIAYAKWAIKQIKRGHTNNERGSFCQDRAEGGWKCDETISYTDDGWIWDTTLADARNCSCRFDPTLAKSVTCKVTFFIRKDEDAEGGYKKYCAKDGYSAIQVAYGDILGGSYNQHYYNDFKEYIDKYWKTQLLMDTWETALKNAKAKLEKVEEGKLCDRKLEKKYKDYNKRMKANKKQKKKQKKAKATE